MNSSPTYPYFLFIFFHYQFGNVIKYLLMLSKILYFLWKSFRLRLSSNPGHRHGYLTCHMTQLEQSDWLRSTNLINIMIDLYFKSIVAPSSVVFCSKFTGDINFLHRLMVIENIFMLNVFMFIHLYNLHVWHSVLLTIKIIPILSYNVLTFINTWLVYVVMWKIHSSVQMKIKIIS